MAPEPMRFNKVRGRHINLSDDGTETTLLGFGYAVCCTNRPLQRGEDLTLNIPGTNAVSVPKLFIGVTKDYPSSLSFKLRRILPPLGDAERGVLSIDSLVYDDSRLYQEIAIYLDENSGDLMIQNVGSEPLLLFSAVDLNGPVYVVLDFFGDLNNVRMGTRSRVVPRAAIGISGGPLQQKAVTSKGSVIEPACFAHPLPLFKIKVTAKEARSCDQSLSRMNFAFVETTLRAKCTLLVRLTELQQCQPVQIVLTTQDVRYAYSYGYLSELCEQTYSLLIESDIPSAGDELAIRISSTGAVSISHNQGSWKERIHVDPLLEYHVVFSMQHVSVLTMIGIKCEDDEEDDGTVESSGNPPREGRRRDASECIICLENSRSVVLIPCFHFALCEACGSTLQRTWSARCPVCRATIVDVKKIYAV